MAKTISGHSTPKSAMAMAIVAIHVAIPMSSFGIHYYLSMESPAMTLVF